MFKRDRIPKGKLTLWKGDLLLTYIRSCLDIIGTVSCSRVALRNLFIFCSENFGKVRRGLKKFGEDWKTLIFTFAYILTANAIVRLGTGLSLHPNFRFRICPNFIKSNSLSVRQLVHQAFYDKYVSVYLWQIRPVLKHFQVSISYGQDCLKSFLLLSSFSVMIQVIGKSTHSA